MKGMVYNTNHTNVSASLITLHLPTVTSKKMQLQDGKPVSIINYTEHNPVSNSLTRTKMLHMSAL